MHESFHLWDNLCSPHPIKRNMIPLNMVHALCKPNPPRLTKIKIPVKSRVLTTTPYYISSFPSKSQISGDDLRNNRHKVPTSLLQNFFPQPILPRPLIPLTFLPQYPFLTTHFLPFNRTYTLKPKIRFNSRPHHLKTQAVIHISDIERLADSQLRVKRSIDMETTQLVKRDV